jgi:NAD(P)-dependent dehydrogenase (short-subunit alcohol dehydrogenase family)
MRLSGKTALIFGGARGIGREVALSFQREGANVAVADLRPVSNLDENKDLGEAYLIDCDVSRDTDVSRAVRHTIEQFGALDILVNNAGIGHPATPFQEFSDDDFSRIMDINLRGTAYGMRAVIPHMMARGSGRIINTASQLAHKPAPQQALYSASKAAVVAMTSAVASELAPHGITVNCVCPGPTETALWNASDPDWIKWKIAQLPIGRAASTSEIASAYVYLASDDASFMIGQSVSPNGGDVMW